MQPLTGLTEIAQLRGPGRDGFYTKMRPRDIRGGGDGSGFLGSGSDGEGYSSSGEGCVKYLGGPLRSYEGKAMKSTLLEVVVRPPIGVNIEAAGSVEEFDWESIESVFTRVVQKSLETEEDDGSSEEEEKEGASGDKNKAKPSSTPSSSTSATNSTSSSTGLNKKMGMEFENVGGLDAQLDDIAVSYISLASTFSFDIETFF